jgi:predicted dienelactone hydrolase
MMSYRLRTVFILVVVLLSLSAVSAQGGTPDAVGLRPDAPPYALHGPYWVGTMGFAAETDYHPTTVAVWYPALNPDGAEEAITYRQSPTIFGNETLIPGYALENAPPDATGGPYPLVIFSHGNRGLRFITAYLSEHLASQGFVVMSIEYADSAAVTTSVDTDLSNYTRPKDVSWQIDYADQLTGAEGALAGLINTEQVAVVGHSYGAYTAEMAAGARWDIRGPTSWCNQYPDIRLPPEFGGYLPLSALCRDWERKLAKQAGLSPVPEGLWPPMGDARVDAIVPLAPEVVEFGAESFKDVTVPVLLLAGSKDRAMFSELPLYQTYLYDNLGSAKKALAVFENADHMVFGTSCSQVPWIVELGSFWACSDPVWDMDRAHDLINHFTTAFLLDVLKGDTAAHAALVPDAVSFPGITYQAQGF